MQPTDSYTHATIETNGVKLHVVQAGPEDGRLVILLHGFPDFWYGWHAQIGALAAAGYRVWVPDQRGYNLSEKPAEVSAYAFDQLAADIAGLIDAAGQEKALIVGHDLGGNAAWWLSIFHPERIEKLVICNDPHPLAFAETFQRRWGQKRRSWYMAVFQIRGLPEWLLSQGNYRRLWQSMSGGARPGTFTEDDHARHVEAWSQPGAFRSMLNWYRAIRPLPALKSRDDWRVRVPTMIIWGMGDPYLLSDLVDASAALCNDVRVERIADATHWVAQDQPEQVSRLILDFLKA